MRRFTLVLCCWLTVLALSNPALAQETTATVTGTVTDQSGGVLPGVTVSLRHVGTGRTFEGVTGAEGGYLVPLLPVGAYEATFTLSGFQSRLVRGITLNVNDRVQVDAQLSLAIADPTQANSGAITVTALLHARFGDSTFDLVLAESGRRSSPCRR